MVEQRKKTSTRRAFVKHSANAAAAAVVGPMVLRQPVFQANDPKQPLSAQQSSGRSQGVARDKAIPPRPYEIRDPRQELYPYSSTSSATSLRPIRTLDSTTLSTGDSPALLLRNARPPLWSREDGSLCTTVRGRLCLPAISTT